MENLFIWLSQAVEGAAAVALLAAFLWGVLSIVLSPCHLASIPLIIGFLGSQGQMTVRRAFWLSSVFSLGILATIGFVGAITAALGRMMGDVGTVGNYFVASLFFVVGLYLLDIIKLSWTSGLGQANMKRRGTLAALMLGLIFGIAVGPCTFAYMAPVLGVTFRVASENILYALGLLLAFGIGHCSIIVLAGTFVEKVQLYLNWTESGPAAKIMKKICGVLVMLGGVWLLYTAR